MVIGPQTVMNDCPKRMTREKFRRKRYFIHENDSRFCPEVIRKSDFLLGQVPIKNMG